MSWIWLSVSRYLEITFGLRGPSFLAFTPFGAVFPGAPNKGNADGAVGIFGHAGCVLALLPNPPKKGLVSHMPLDGADIKYRNVFLFFFNALRSPFWTLIQSEAPKRNNGRLEALRLPVLAELPPGGRAATLTPLYPMYGTRPCCLVQAITQYTCPDPHFGSGNNLAH